MTRKEVSAVILFGSIARGEATPGSDIDLAVIAPPGWDKRVELEDSVRTRLGNDCDVLFFTHAESTGSPPPVSPSSLTSSATASS